MPYEVTCPSCQARLLAQDDAAAASFICPRCLNEVPHPAGAGRASTRGAEASPITALSPSAPPVPAAATEGRRWMWRAYFIVLTLTLLAGLGVILAASAPGGQSDALIVPAFLCDAVLTILILFPAAYALVRSTRSAPATPLGITVFKRVVIIGLLAVVGPIAAYIVFVTVCIASLVASSR